MSRIWLPVVWQEVVEHDFPDHQPTNDPQPSGAQATVSTYVPLNEATRSPEVTDPPRQAQVSVYASQVGLFYVK